jgi:hypothetical protein
LGILEFQENVHFKIIEFGLLALKKGIFGKLEFGKSYCNRKINIKNKIKILKKSIKLKKIKLKE